MTLLALSDVTASYGVSQALYGINFTVAEGEIVALMGRNGMGKSTTVKCICHMMPYQGKLFFNKIDTSNLASYEIARLGVGLVPEGRRCFADLTVEENLIAASRKGVWTIKKVVDLFPRLGERRSQPASTLSGGEQQMLVIARALMTNPRLLLLDEATEGLAPIVRNEIWAAINELKSQTGLSILIIDKSIKELRRVCDKTVILERGRSVWSGSMNQLSADITEQYLGV